MLFSLFLLLLLFLVYFLAFRWYSGFCSYHSTSHSKSPPVNDSVCDTSSVLKKPTTTTTTTVTNMTPSFPVPLQDVAPVPLPSRELNQPLAVKAPQPYDAFLVLDVEATCLHGSDFQWPNEIIEWPVCLLKWIDKRSNDMAGTLQKVAEFRSFVKPTWRPKLTPFCTSLTGITQEQVDGAPHFPEVTKLFSAFLVQHGLIHPVTGERLVRFCWCTDGPFDIRDFVVKQCFISSISIPPWLRGDVMDVRKAVSAWSELSRTHTSKPTLLRRMSPNIESQLRFLGLAPFEGRQHCGIDDSRNIARIVIELARRGVRLMPNTPIQPGRRWPWMGKPGQILVQYL